MPSKGGGMNDVRVLKVLINLGPEGTSYEVEGIPWNARTRRILTMLIDEALFRTSGERDHYVLEHQVPKE